MRILALKAKGRVLPHIHEAMVRAFRNLGVEVDNFPIPQNDEEYSLVEEKLKRKYQAIFCLDMGGEETFIGRIKEWQLKYRQPWLIWFVDDPEGYGFPQSCASAYTWAFCWDKGITEEMLPICSELGGFLSYLPLATDPGVFFPEKAKRLGPWQGVFVGVLSHFNELFEKITGTSSELIKEVKRIWEVYERDFSISLHDLIWREISQKTLQPAASLKSNWLARLWVKVCLYQIGIKKRKEAVFRILNGQDAVFGDDRWRLVLRKDLYRGEIEYGDEVRSIYNQASFILDLRPAQSRTGITQRIFDASACGVPTLMEWSRELELLFDSPEELFYFRNLAEAEETRELILKDREKTKKKVGKILRITLGEHTFLNRARFLLEELKKF